jgi:phosphatidylglycerol---prolipoprotein diacylglyceryl transferase
MGIELGRRKGFTWLDLPLRRTHHPPMPLFALPFPAIDPIAVSFGPFAVRWYALAYVAGILGAWWLARTVAGKPKLWGGKAPMTPNDIDDVIAWCAIGIVVGGRLGYVLFYNPAYFLSNPLEIPVLWRGGMSFHGGFLGVILALFLFARGRKIPFRSMLDIAALVTPIGLFLGRIANFVNGELWGRVTDVPWAFIFPGGGLEPRHPSQLYQAALEGLLLFIALLIALRGKKLASPGFMGGLFVFGYGVARIIGELFREPDAHIGYLWGGLTMGMILSIPMLALGGWMIATAIRR